MKASTCASGVVKFASFNCALLVPVLREATAVLSAELLVNAEGN